MATSFLILITIVHILGLGLVLASEATIYTVGDAGGWDISSDLPSWAASKNFYVGDSLWFQYSRYHTLNMVDRAGFDLCNSSSALMSASDGNTTVPLTTPGDKYFVCGMYSHCLGGMKLQVNVKTPQGAPSPAATPPPPPPPRSPPPEMGALPIQRPSTVDDNHHVEPPASSGGVCDVRGSIFVGWWFTIGALLMLVVMGV